MIHYTRERWVGTSTENNLSSVNFLLSKYRAVGVWSFTDSSRSIATDLFCVKILFWYIYHVSRCIICTCVISMYMSLTLSVLRNEIGNNKLAYIRTWHVRVCTCEIILQNTSRNTRSPQIYVVVKYFLAFNTT